jgi:hypothetical protein
MPFIIKIIICGVLIFLIEKINRPPLPRTGEKSRGMHGQVISARYKEKSNRFNANFILVPMLILIFLSLFTDK